MAGRGQLVGGRHRQAPILGMHQRQIVDADKGFRVIAQHGLPGVIDANEVAGLVADAQDVLGGVEETVQVPRRRPFAFGRLPRPRLAFRQGVLGQVALDDDRRQMGGGGDGGDVVGVRRARLPLIHGEGAQDTAARAHDRLRPAGGQASLGGEILIVDPERIRGDIRNHDPPLQIGRAAAGAGVETDLGPIDRLAIEGGQARRRAQGEAPAILEQQDAAQHARLEAFDPGDDGLEDLVHGIARGDMGGDPSQQVGACEAGRLGSISFALRQGHRADPPRSPARPRPDAPANS